MLFKKKKSTPPALLVSLDRALEYARVRKEASFYYPLEEHEVSQAMAWAIRNRVAVQPDHITDGTLIYKFFGYFLDN